MAAPMDEYAPFDTGAGSNVTEDGWRSMMRRVSISGVVRGQGSEMLPFGNSTGMLVSIPPGEVQIESHWGKINTTQTHAITSNSSGSTRYDLVVARANFTTNVVEFDVLAGTPGAGAPPAVTRNTAQWEVPLAVVVVVSGAVTIAAADVRDARQWGGPPVTTVTDDFLWWGDKISSCSRFNITGDNAAANSNLYFVRMHSLGEQTCSEIRLCPSVLPSGGTVAVRIFRGFRADLLTSFVDPTTSTFLYGGSAGSVHTSAIPATTFRAGEIVVVAIRSDSTGTAPSLFSNAISASVATTNFLNPFASSVMVTGFKATASMPSTLNLLDSSWTKRDRVFWTALA